VEDRGELSSLHAVISADSRPVVSGQHRLKVMKLMNKHFLEYRYVRRISFKSVGDENLPILPVVDTVISTVASDIQCEE
jgi:hypothetical protein